MVHPNSYYSHDVASYEGGDFRYEGGYGNVVGAADPGGQQGALADGFGYDMGYASEGGGGYYSDAHQQAAAYSQHSDFSQGSGEGYSYAYGQAMPSDGDSYSYGQPSQAVSAPYRQPEQLQQPTALQYSGYDPSATFHDGSYSSNAAGQELFYQDTSGASYGGFFANDSSRDYSNALGSPDASYTHSGVSTFSNEYGDQQQGVLSAPQQRLQPFPERDVVGYSTLPLASRAVGSGRAMRGGGGRGGRGAPQFQHRHGNPY
jgi:hypothetical protein